MEEEIMNNEEVYEITEEEEVVDQKSHKGLVAIAVAGAAALVGTIAYKKIVKPLIAKRKAKKELEASDDCDEDNVVEFQSKETD